MRKLKFKIKTSKNWEKFTRKVNIFYPKKIKSFKKNKTFTISTYVKSENESIFFWGISLEESKPMKQKKTHLDSFIL